MQKRYKITVINSAGNRYEVKYLPDNIERITMQIQCNLSDLPLIINRGVSVDTLRFVKEDFQYLHKIFSEKNWNNCKIEINYNENTQTFGIDFAKYKWTVAYCEIGLKFSELQNLVDNFPEIKPTPNVMTSRTINDNVAMIAHCGLLFHYWNIIWQIAPAHPDQRGNFFDRALEMSDGEQYSNPTNELTNGIDIIHAPLPTPPTGGSGNHINYNSHNNIKSIFSWKVRNSSVTSTQLFTFKTVSRCFANVPDYSYYFTPKIKVGFLVFMEYKDLSGDWQIAPGHTFDGFNGTEGIDYYIGGANDTNDHTLSRNYYMPTQYPFDGSSGYNYPACTEAIVHFCQIPYQSWNANNLGGAMTFYAFAKISISDAWLHFNYNVSGTFNLISAKKVLNTSGLFNVSNMIDKYFLTISNETLKISDLLKQLTAVFGFIFYENNGKYEVMQTWPNFPTETIQKADIYDISYESLQNYAKIKYLQNSNIINPKPSTADVLDYSTEFSVEPEKVMQAINSGKIDVLFSVTNNHLDHVTPTIWRDFHRFILNYIENNITNFNPLFENYIVKCKIKSNNFTFFNFATLKNVQIDNKKAFILKSESSDNLDTFDVTAIFYR